ncbi:MAG: hypothetical protein M1812_002998 [Candelaria pacifica]|nr:MAG: hypothetical protein M1812_002998 [Candelaria pacifica]
MTSDIRNLFQNVQTNFPSSLRADGWYIAVTSALITLNHQAQIPELYLYLIGLEEFKTAEQRKRLSLRLRDVFMKVWTLVGIPKVIEAVVALAKVEAVGDVESEGTKDGVKLDKELERRGTESIGKIYRDNLQPIFNSFGSHANDFEWLEKNIIYGLFLSDNSVLSDVETQLVTVPAMLCQGLKGPTMWHLRGTRRLGVSEEDVEGVQVAVEMVAKWAGRSTEGWARVKDIEKEV